MPTPEGLNPHRRSPRLTSVAPAPPAPTKAAPVIDDKAIPIQGKQAKEKPKPTPVTPPKVQQPVPQNKAQYGEQAANNLPRAVQGVSTPGPTSITQGDFGSRFPWYVDAINRKMQQTWNKAEVDPRTPKGTRIFLDFTIHRDGTTSDVKVERSSGSSTLDRSCMRAVQRVDTFGALPGGYSGSSLNVSYYCEY